MSSARRASGVLPRGGGAAGATPPRRLRSPASAASVAAAAATYTWRCGIERTSTLPRQTTHTRAALLRTPGGGERFTDLESATVGLVKMGPGGFEAQP